MGARRSSTSWSLRRQARGGSTSAAASPRCASTTASGSSARRSRWRERSAGAAGESRPTCQALRYEAGGQVPGSPDGRRRSRTCSSTQRSPVRPASRGRSSCAVTRSSRFPASSTRRGPGQGGSQTELERDVAEILIDEDRLRSRVLELGEEISADYAGRDLLLIGVLKGAVFFMADLMPPLTIPCEIDFMAISSYGAQTDSSGVVRILKDLDINIEGRDVLVVEDIIDSGLPLSYLMRNLESREPASLEVCALLTKPERREIDVPVRYTGFEIPNRFVIGYGLDFGERYRNLPYVAVLSDDLLPEGV